MPRPAASNRDSLDLIGAATSAGAPHSGCAAGPAALAAAGLVASLTVPGRQVQWAETLHANPVCDRLLAVSEFAVRLARCVGASLDSGRFPLVVGGDHSCAIGTWRAAANHLRPQGPLGLLWIDAHLDSHTNRTTASGALHGMPVASLLGFGSPELIGQEPALHPEHVALVGAASFEPDEAALLLALGVRVFPLAEIKRRGLDEVLADALAIVTAGTAGFGADDRSGCDRSVRCARCQRTGDRRDRRRATCAKHRQDRRRYRARRDRNRRVRPDARHQRQDRAIGAGADCKRVGAGRAEQGGRRDPTRADFRCAQLFAASGGTYARPGRARVGPRRPALSRHALGLLGGESRALASADRPRAARAGGAIGGNLARVSQRSPAGVRRAAMRDHRARCSATGQHRAGGGGDRAQSGAQVGLSGQRGAPTIGRE